MGPATLFALFFVVSIGLHIGGGAAALRYAGGYLSRVVPPKPRIEVAVVETKPPPPARVEPKHEAAPRTAEVRRKLLKIPRELPPPAPDAPPPPPDMKPAPPPPNAEAANPAPNAPLITGISLSSTTAGNSSMTVNVGNTLYGTPRATATAPAEVRPYKAERYAPQYQLAEQPRCLNVLSAEDVRKFYPPEAAADRLEADVLLKLTIDDDGSVVRAVIVKDPGHGFGEAARRRMMKERFIPGKLNGTPVATEINYTVRFEHED